MGYDRAIADLKRFSQAEWSSELTFTSPTPNSEVAVVRGFNSKHHLQIDPENGIPVNSMNAHVAVTESVLLDANEDYPTRDADNEIYLKDHLVSFADSSGNASSFQIKENFPDQTLDLIVCILGVYVD